MQNWKKTKFTSTYKNFFKFTQNKVSTIFHQKSLSLVKKKVPIFSNWLYTGIVPKLADWQKADLGTIPPVKASTDKNFTNRVISGSA